VKNAPAATARRATSQIVRGPVQQVLAEAGTETATETATQVAMEIAAPAVRETQTEAPAAIVVADHNVRVATTPLIAPAAMANGHTRRVRLVTAIRVHPVVMVIALIHHGPPATAIDPIHRGPPVTAIRVRPAAVAIVPTLLVLRAMAIPVRAAMAMTDHVFPAATAIQAAGLLGAMAIRRVDRPAPAEIDPIRHAPRATARDQSVPVAIGLTVLVRIARIGRVLIGRVPIVPMATSRGESGSPMGESVARSARR
jgi:hypothetical protein